jgi:hypothetical protein
MTNPEISSQLTAERALVILSSVGARQAAAEDIVSGLAGDGIVCWFPEGPLYNTNFRYFQSREALSKATAIFAESDRAFASVRVLTRASCALFCAVGEQGGEVLSFRSLVQRSKPGSAEFENPVMMIAESSALRNEVIAIPLDRYHEQRLVDRYGELCGFELSLRPFPNDHSEDEINLNTNFISRNERTTPRQSHLIASASITLLAAVFSLLAASDQKKSETDVPALSAITLPERESTEALASSRRGTRPDQSLSGVRASQKPSFAANRKVHGSGLSDDAAPLAVDGQGKK